MTGSYNNIIRVTVPHYLISRTWCLTTGSGLQCGGWLRWLLTGAYVNRFEAWHWWQMQLSLWRLCGRCDACHLASVCQPAVCCRRRTQDRGPWWCCCTNIMARSDSTSSEDSRWEPSFSSVSLAVLVRDWLVTPQLSMLRDLEIG